MTPEDEKTMEIVEAMKEPLAFYMPNLNGELMLYFIDMSYFRMPTIEEKPPIDEHLGNLNQSCFFGRAQDRWKSGMRNTQIRYGSNGNKRG